MRSALLSSIALLRLVCAHELYETVYGVYIFSRHGDRTPKALAPTNLTPLGYQQVFQRGEYYRRRYVSKDAPFRINGISEDTINLSQIAVSAPVDNVLQSSASAFLQGLYPVFETNQTLRNGTTITAPMGGYQLAPISTVSQGSGGENSGWLQDASGCSNAKTSSSNYFLSEEYRDLLASTQSFYDRLAPVINSTFDDGEVSFQNGYTIFDYINVATIHNETIPSDDLLDNSTLLQLRTLADHHEFGLAYNASDNARAIQGMQLAAEIVDHLNNTITSEDAPKFGIQFGAYDTFLSFFGLANLTTASEDFYGLNDYASTMVFELFAAGNSTTAPAVEDLQVRFFFHNGTAAASVELVQFPLFGDSEFILPWTTFTEKMDEISIHTTEQWCVMCGDSTGNCAAFADQMNNGSSAGDGVMSNTVAGVIGAMVTLGVILGLQALILLFGGFTLVNKKKVDRSPSPASSTFEDLKA